MFSPSINVDDGWIPVKKYIEEDLGVNVEKDQAYWEDWDEAALRRILQQAAQDHGDVLEVGDEETVSGADYPGRPCGHAAIA